VNAIDVWRSAHLLLQQHGKEALVIATERSDALLDSGDTSGSRVWMQIVRAIIDLERTEPHPGEAVN